MSSRKQDRVRDELEAIRKVNKGRLPLKAVVAWAKSHKTSDLHSMFTWNVQKAAYNYWLSEAREIVTRYITVEVVHHSQTITVPYYVRDPDMKSNESGYISTTDKLDCRQAQAILTQRIGQIAALVESSRDMAVVMDSKCPGLSKKFQRWLRELVTLEERLAA